MIGTACNDCYCHFLLEVSQHVCSFSFNFVQLTEIYFYVKGLCFESISYHNYSKLTDCCACIRACACVCVHACVHACMCVHVVCV